MEQRKLSLFLPCPTLLNLHVLLDFIHLPFSSLCINREPNLSLNNAGNCLPPFCRGKCSDLFENWREGTFNVGHWISRFKTWKDDCVLERVWMCHIDHLEVHLERISSMVSTYLNPDFFLGDNSVVPCEGSMTVGRVWGRLFQGQNKKFQTKLVLIFSN